MSGEIIEAATDRRLVGTFPRQWTKWNGPPPVNADERAGWIRVNLVEGEARRAAGEKIGWLHLTTAAEAFRRLEYRQTDPATLARARQVHLAARKVGPA